MSECPQYYRLADGSEFYEYSRDKIVPMCRTNGLSVWDTHCVISACEHLFRMGAKEGEESTDWAAYKWWKGMIGSCNTLVFNAIVHGVLVERRKVGR